MRVNVELSNNNCTSAYQKLTISRVDRNRATDPKTDNRQIRLYFCAEFFRLFVRALYQNGKSMRNNAFDIASTYRTRSYAIFDYELKSAKSSAMLVPCISGRLLCIRII